MFSHVMIGTNDLEKAKSFYDALLGTLGVPPAQGGPPPHFLPNQDRRLRCVEADRWQARDPANGGTIGFTASSPEQADAWHAAGIANGATTCEEPPGVREGAGVKLYLAYLRDPDGNKLCAMHRMALTCSCRTLFRNSNNSAPMIN